MLLLNIFIAIAVVGITVGVLLDKYTSLNDLGVAFVYAGVFASLIAFGVGFTLININSRFEDQLNRYEVITAMVESYDGQDYGNMQSLTEAVIRMNSTIARHKAFYGNIWTGIWYSEDIAKLEPIIFGKQTPLKE